jgi:hypothetical protein
LKVEDGVEALTISGKPFVSAQLAPGMQIDQF